MSFFGIIIQKNSGFTKGLSTNIHVHAYKLFIISFPAIQIHGPRSPNCTAGSAHWNGPTADPPSHWRRSAHTSQAWDTCWENGDLLVVVCILDSIVYNVQGIRVTDKLVAHLGVFHPVVSHMTNFLQISLEIFVVDFGTHHWAPLSATLPG